MRVFCTAKAEESNKENKHIISKFFIKDFIIVYIGEIEHRLKRKDKAGGGATKSNSVSAGLTIPLKSARL